MSKNTMNIIETYNLKNVNIPLSLKHQLQTQVTEITSNSVLTWIMKFMGSFCVPHCKTYFRRRSQLSLLKLNNQWTLVGHKAESNLQQHWCSHWAPRYSSLFNDTLFLPACCCLCPSIHIPYLSAHPFQGCLSLLQCLPNHLSTPFSFPLSVHPSIFICLSLHPSAWLSLSVSQFLCLSMHLPFSCCLSL